MTTDDRLHSLRQSMREAVTEQIDKPLADLRRVMNESAQEQMQNVRDIQSLIQLARRQERYMISDFIAGSCQGFTADQIATAVRPTDVSHTDDARMGMMGAILLNIRLDYERCLDSIYKLPSLSSLTPIEQQKQLSHFFLRLKQIDYALGYTNEF